MWTFEICPAQPAQKVTVSEDEVRRVVTALQASGYQVVLDCEKDDDGWPFDAVANVEGIVSQMKV